MSHLPYLLGIRFEALTTLDGPSKSTEIQKKTPVCMSYCAVPRCLWIMLHWIGSRWSELYHTISGALPIHSLESYNQRDHSFFTLISGSPHIFRLIAVNGPLACHGICYGSLAGPPVPDCSSSNIFNKSPTIDSKVFLRERSNTPDASVTCCETLTRWSTRYNN